MAETMEEKQASLRRAMSMFPTGIIAVCAEVDGEVVGIPVNSFTSVSLEPPLVSVSVARTSTTWPKLVKSPSLGLSVMGASHGDFCRRLASRGAPNKFENVSWHKNADSAVFIEDAVLWLECKISAEYDGGDHDIVLLKVLDEQAFPEVEPLIFYQSNMRELG